MGNGGHASRIGCGGRSNIGGRGVIGDGPPLALLFEPQAAGPGCLCQL